MLQFVTDGSQLLSTLSESCRDDSYNEMCFVIKQMITYYKAMAPEMAAVIKRLQAYRDLIESLDSADGGNVGDALSMKGYDRNTQATWISSHQGAIVKQIGEAWSASLTSEQRGAIRAYTGSLYSDINATLRGLKKGLNRGFASADNEYCAKQIYSALSDARIPCDCVVYRGMSSAALGNLENLSDEELVGKVYTDNGFMSTSLNRNDAFSGKVQLEIEVPAGTNGAYVGYIGQHGHAESEVLLNMGQYLKIKNVSRDQYGNRIIRARVMLQKESENEQILVRRR